MEKAPQQAESPYLKPAEGNEQEWLKAVRQLLAIRYRPVAGSGEAPWYCPDRDLAHIGHALLQCSVSVLPPPEECQTTVAQCFRKLEVTVEQLHAAMIALQNSVNHEWYAQSDGKVVHEGITSALEAGGWMDTDPMARSILLQALGEVVLGWIFVCTRQEIKLGDLPKTYEDMFKLNNQNIIDHTRAALVRDLKKEKTSDE